MNVNMDKNSQQNNVEKNNIESMSSREVVQKHYAKTAHSVSCGSCSTNESAVYDLKDLVGIPLDAIRASRGCANPHKYAHLQEGESVLDLGCGGGIDCLLAAREVGQSGKVVGLDMTDEMLELAEKNRLEAGFENVSFVKGFIEDIPFESSTFNVVISNCVINLSTNKQAVLNEAFRVLQDGGRFVVADIVETKDVSANTLDKMTRFLGCGSKILSEVQYVNALKTAGFKDANIEIYKVYSKEALEIRAQRKHYEELLAGINLEEADGAFAGAIVVANKGKGV